MSEELELKINADTAEVDAAKRSMEGLTDAVKETSQSSDELTKKTEQTNDAIKKTSDSATNAKNSLSGLQRIVHGLSRLMSGDLIGGSKMLVGGFLSLRGATGDAEGGFAAFGTAAANAFSKIGGLITANPIIAAVTAVGGVFFGLAKHAESAANKTAEQLKRMTDAYHDAWAEAHRMMQQIEKDRNDPVKRAEAKGDTLEALRDELERAKKLRDQYATEQRNAAQDAQSVDFFVAQGMKRPKAEEMALASEKASGEAATKVLEFSDAIDTLEKKLAEAREKLSSGADASQTKDDAAQERARREAIDAAAKQQNERQQAVDALTEARRAASMENLTPEQKARALNRQASEIEGNARAELKQKDSGLFGTPTEVETRVAKAIAEAVKLRAQASGEEGKAKSEAKAAQESFAQTQHDIRFKQADDPGKARILGEDIKAAQQAALVASRSGNRVEYFRQAETAEKKRAELRELVQQPESMKAAQRISSGSYVTDVSNAIARGMFPHGGGKHGPLSAKSPEVTKLEDIYRILTEQQKLWLRELGRQ